MLFPLLMIVEGARLVWSRIRGRSTGPRTSEEGAASTLTSSSNGRLSVLVAISRFTRTLRLERTRIDTRSKPGFIQMAATFAASLRSTHRLHTA